MLTDAEIDALLALGLLRYAERPMSHDELRAEAEGYGLLEPDLFGRSYGLDAEELAEGGAVWALEEIRAVLETNGVTVGLVSVEYDAGSGSTLLLVNGEPHILDSDAFDSNVSWRTYSVSFFAIVNKLLAQAGSSERLFGFRLFANDQTGVFLTPQLHEALERLGIGDSLEFPQNAV